MNRFLIAIVVFFFAFALAVPPNIVSSVYKEKVIPFEGTLLLQFNGFLTIQVNTRPIAFMRLISIKRSIWRIIGLAIAEMPL
jgi:hypothetical protein